MFDRPFLVGVDRIDDRPMILAFAFVEFRLRRAMVRARSAVGGAKPSGGREKHAPTSHQPFVKGGSCRRWFPLRNGCDIAQSPPAKCIESPIIINTVLFALYIGGWRTPK